jgi:ATP/maltotriose-dependent transcriptional regulator MalT
MRSGGSTETAKTHVKHIYQKLGVRGRRGAVDKARDLGLLDPQSTLRGSLPNS